MIKMCFLEKNNSAVIRGDLYRDIVPTEIENVC